MQLQAERAELVRTLLERWREDPGGTYRSWFLWDQRLKNFRSIRRGLQLVVEEVEGGRFGNVYRGSSLETVVKSIAEQRQIFKGADHAFLWKPKLRIPDIYENARNQQSFASFLDTCTCCTSEDAIIAAIHELDAKTIKGLGPAVANLLYFLHPTLVPPFNTAIVRGYNLLMGTRVKLGRWVEFLAMRAGVMSLNQQFRDLLSNDLGAIGGFLFDIGMGRFELPQHIDEESVSRWREELQRLREHARSAQDASLSADDLTHTQVQGWLRDLGLSLGFTVWVASNDRGRSFGNGRLGDGCLDELGVDTSMNAEAVKLIDILWLDRQGNKVEAAFEVEHTTSIYSGIVRMLDLALGPNSGHFAAYFLVAPDEREQDVRAQFSRPAFSRVANLPLKFLPYSELASHRESIARFGSGLKAIHAIARRLTTETEI